MRPSASIITTPTITVDAAQSGRVTLIFIVSAENIVLQIKKLKKKLCSRGGACRTEGLVAAAGHTPRSLVGGWSSRRALSGYRRKVPPVPASPLQVSLFFFLTRLILAMGRPVCPQGLLQAISTECTRLCHFNKINHIK